MKKNKIEEDLNDYDMLYNKMVKDTNKSKFCVEFLLNRELPNKKSKSKVDNDNFEVPMLIDYNKILDNNYNIQQLKQISKHFGIKISGNKLELRKRLYNYMHISYYIIYIQKISRGKIVKKYMELHGPGLKDRSVCSNDIDFLTLDNLKDIPYSQFFSYKDEDGFVYKFNILSFYNLYKKHSDKLYNPLSTKIIDKSIVTSMLNYIKYSKLLKIEINISYNDVIIEDENKKLEMRILNIFQTMDSYGNYTNISWLKKLNKIELIKFIKEVAELWNYRVQLTQEVKREISPPYGNPFLSCNININGLNVYSYKNILKMVILLIEELITKGTTYDNRVLGCYYVLSCFTLVSSEAAEAMPWLYESAIYN